jgi:4-amino-4-deoxy-L-arabinose transferase-like glycosyltransferase
VRSRFRPRWSSSRPSPFVARLALIALAALCLRVVYALTIAGHDNLDVAVGDRFFFVEGAKLLAKGQGFVHPFTYEALHVSMPSAAHPPLWLLVLTPFAKLGLLTYTSARVIGAAVGATVVVLAGLLGRRLAGERAGLIAGGIAAAYPAWIVGDTSGMSEALSLAFVAAALLAVLDRRAVLAGLAVGLAVLTRAEALLLVPLLLWPALWGRGALLASAAVLVLVLPWSVATSASLDHPVVVSTNGATVLAGANCDSTYHGRDLGFWLPSCLEAAARRGSPTYDEGVLADRWEAAGEHYAEHHAARLPAVMAVRVLRTWRLWQPLRNTSEGENGTAVKVASLWFLVLLLPVGLLGLRRLRSRPLLALCALVTVTSALGWGSPRFARPAELALMLAAAAYVAATRGSSSGARPSRPT